MYSIDTIRAQIKTVLDSVTGVANVYEYRRRADSWEDFLDMFQDGNYINGWQIYLEGWTEDLQTFGGGGFGGTTRVTYKFKIGGIYGLQDSAASEMVFVTLVKNIAIALNQSAALQSYVLDGESRVVNGVQLSHVVMSGVLSHLAEFDLTFMEDLDG